MIQLDIKLGIAACIESPGSWMGSNTEPPVSIRILRGDDAGVVYIRPLGDDSNGVRLPTRGEWRAVGGYEFMTDTLSDFGVVHVREVDDGQVQGRGAEQAGGDAA